MFTFLQRNNKIIKGEKKNLKVSPDMFFEEEHDAYYEEKPTISVITKDRKGSGTSLIRTTKFEIHETCLVKL